MHPWIKWLLRLALILIGLATVFVFIVAIAFTLVNRTNGNIISGGEKRAYLLYVPGSYDPSTPTPLVISIHGFAEWPAHQAQISHWNDLAEQEGFIVVYPSGTGFPLRWRASGSPGSAAGPQVEVAFISDLLDHLESEYNLDPRRIYANGLSNGGGMTFVLSCTLAERIAAVGMVSGAYLFPWEACQPSRPIPAIVFHGTADPIVPYQGGPSESFDVPFPLIPDWVATLARQNGCGAVPLEIPASGEVSGIRYTGCAADVIFYTIAGGGHAWPGGEPMPEFIVGHTTQDIDATQAMWDFFQAHPLPEE
jgi:polyhydroxybutyrate depolymerase